MWPIRKPPGPVHSLFLNYFLNTKLLLIPLNNNRMFLRPIFVAYSKSKSNKVIMKYIIL